MSDMKLALENALLVMVRVLRNKELGPLLLPGAIAMAERAVKEAEFPTDHVPHTNC